MKGNIFQGNDSNTAISHRTHPINLFQRVLKYMLNKEHLSHQSIGL